MGTPVPPVLFIGDGMFVHIGKAKILNIIRRATNEIDVALPFETDAYVLAAWDHFRSCMSNALKDFGAKRRFRSGRRQSVGPID